jgi:plastocyanin
MIDMRRGGGSTVSAWAAYVCIFAACGSNDARAAVVTVTVKTTSGGVGEDTIVVFDPLDAAPPPAHSSAVIDQVDKRFVPKVTVLRTGTSVTFPNSDRIRHQVYSFSTPKVFSLKLYAGSPQVDVVFDKPGLVVLGCNIHDTMVAFVGVVDSPYFTKIGKSGTADVKLPAGHYRLRAWVPTLMSPVAPRTVTVDRAPQSIPVVIDSDPTSEAVAAWPE